MIRENINQLIEEITRNHPQEDIFQAKKEFQKISGEIFEDDKSYDSRMGSFLEWYTFDRISPESKLTPLQQYLQNKSAIPAHKDLAEAISHGIHGLFIAKKVKNDCVIVVDVMDNEKYRVLENQGSIFFNSDDFFEGRIIPFNGQYFFTDHFCYHPKPTVGFILSKVKTLKGSEKEALAKEKRLQKEIVSPQKSLKKITAKLEKTSGKLAGTTKESKIQSLKEEIANLENQKTQLESQISNIENELTQLKAETIEGEHQLNRFNLIRKLSYMSLKWERSRQIDVRDIYQD
jgi:septation ring formation regulator EzrA